MATWRGRFAVLVLGVFLAGGMRAPAAPLTISVAEKTGAWRVEEATGRIFVSLPDSDAIVEYSPATGKEVRRFEVPGNPTELIIKARWLVAACPKNVALAVIDLKTNAASGKVALNGKGPSALFCSKVDNALAYAICNTGEAWRDGEVFQIDLAARQVRKRVKVQGWRQSHPVHVAMSADGRFISPDARGVTSPSGGDLMSVDEEACTFENRAHHHASFGQTVADPSGRWWTLGNQLFPLDLSGAIRTFSGAPVAIHPALDLAASVKGLDVYLETFSDARLLKTVKLDASDENEEEAETPRTAPPGSGTKTSNRSRSTTSSRARTSAASRGSHSGGDVTLQFDLAGERLVYGLESKAYVIALADLGVAFQPRLQILGPSRLELIMGKPARVPLGVCAAAEAGGTTFSLSAAPAYAKIEGSHLVLSPGPKDLGAEEIVVKGVRGALSDTLTIHVKVAVPYVELDFQAMNVAADREGKCAVVWGPKGGTQEGHPGNIFEQPMAFAVVGLKESKLAGSQRLATGIRQLAVDDKYLYLTLGSGNLLYRLDRADLTQRKKIFLDGEPRQLAALPDQHVAVMFGEHYQASVAVFDRETLKRNPKHYGERSLGSSGIDGPPSFWDPAGDGLLKFAERLIEARTGEVRCLLSPLSLPRLALPASASAMRHRSYPGQPRQMLWGRCVMGQMLATAQGSRIATLTGPAEISPDFPLAVSTRSTSEMSLSKTILEFRSLKMGDVVQSVEIESATPRGHSFSPYSYGQRGFRLVADNVLLPQGQRLHICPIAAEVRKIATPPLMLKYPKLAPASVDQRATVQFAAEGGEGELTYALTAEYEGLAIDAASGKVTVDLPLLWKRYLAGPPSTPAIYRGGVAAASGTADPAAFQRATGQQLPAGMTAFWLPIEVAVSDGSGQQDQVSVALVALAPTEPMQKQAAARQAEAERQRQRMQEEMQRRAQEAAARPPGPAEAGDRVGQLEARVRRLEASLDAVLQKLDQIEQGPRPARTDAPRFEKAEPRTERRTESLKEPSKQP